MRAAVLVLSLSLLAPALHAQEQEFERPDDWTVRFDRAGSPDSAIYFVSMPPGWHITTGPAAILYDPARVVHGEYRVESFIHLFPVERNEAFGVFLGGSDLKGSAQAYTYFLIRKDGKFLIKERSGSDTRVIHPWTESAAIVKYEGQEGTAKNQLAVEVGSDTVDFFVNGEKVASLPRSEVKTDGIVGLRVNHGLNLHVTSLDIAQT
jgi:hypothetical protein